MMPPVVPDDAPVDVQISNGGTSLESVKVKEMSIHPFSADQEYAKTTTLLKKSDIDELTDWVKQQPHLPADITEEQLILFHHSCYYKMEDTKNCIKVYFSLRIGSSEYFVKRDVNTPSLQQALNTLEYGIFPVRNPNGYQIIFHRLRICDASKYVFVDGVKLLAMAIDACNFVEGTLPGYVFLFDMKGVKLAHLTRLNLSQLKKFFSYVQEGLPVRLKAIHVLNTRPIIDKIMLLVRPFMKKELLNMIHFHAADNLEEVYQFLPPYCLPSDFGGELQNCEQLHADFIKWMDKLKKHFEEDEKKYTFVNTKKKDNLLKTEKDDFHDLAID
ncbi:hypothetical protein PGB90_004425 [Kerria lacca]